MKKASVLLLLLIGLVLLTAGSAQATRWETFDASADCDGWRVDAAAKVGADNHPDAWPTEQLEIGGTMLDKDLLISLMRRNTRHHVSVSLLRHLVAAKLNILSGCENLVADSIAGADAFFADKGLNPCLNRSERQIARAIKRDLQRYNRGQMSGDKGLADDSDARPRLGAGVVVPCRSCRESLDWTRITSCFGGSMLARKSVRIDPRVGWFADVRTVLSPMAGVTDRSFRDICKDHGAGLTFCEFTAAKGLTYDNEQTWRLVDTEGETGRVGVQIFGAEPDAMAEAASLMADVRLDVLDINLGCPAKKVVQKCGGSALLADVPRLRDIVEAVVAASPAPVSAKIRTGWDEGSVNYREIGLLLQEAGCCWVTLHGRTRAQKFRGSADWDAIADLVETLAIPVIGNGDVVDGDTYRSMVEQTGCHAVMVGRGAMGNPWIFREMDAVDGLLGHTPPNLGEIIDVVERQIRDIGRLRGERFGSQLVRKHVVRYFRGFPGAAAIRRRIFAEESSLDMLAVLTALRAEIDFGLDMGDPEGKES